MDSSTYTVEQPADDQTTEERPWADPSEAEITRVFRPVPSRGRRLSLLAQTSADPVNALRRGR
jgi:hypothetical protein